MKERLSIVPYAIEAMQAAGQSICSIYMSGDERGTVLGMKALMHITSATLETARLMVLAAPEGVDREAINAARRPAKNRSGWKSRPSARSDMSL
jgi:hypothetical protein